MRLHLHKETSQDVTFVPIVLLSKAFPFLLHVKFWPGESRGSVLCATPPGCTDIAGWKDSEGDSCATYKPRPRLPFDIRWAAPDPA